MTPLSLAVPESRRCRARAREYRSLAALFRGQNTRDKMLRVAADYERMAQDAKEREIAQGLLHLSALARNRHPAR